MLYFSILVLKFHVALGAITQTQPILSKLLIVSSTGDPTFIVREETENTIE